MKNLLSKKAFVAFAAGTMLLSSCHDNDIYDPSDIVKDYADNWQKTFGDIDPNQDWNVATSVTANATLNIPGSSTMKIYTANPLSSDSRLLAVTNLNNGVGSISFDAIKGSSSLFVAIYQDNEYIIFDNYPVVNGLININATSGVAKVATRSVFTDKWPNSDVPEHSCDWEGKLAFTVPTGAEDITKQNYDPNATVFYIPESYTGGSFSYNLNNGGAIYNYAHLTSLSGNAGGDNVSIYNAGTIDCYSPSSGHIDIYNTGTITLGSYANFYDIFNSGTLVLARIHDPWNKNEGTKLGGVDGKITIHSAGEEAVILMPDGGGNFDAGLDVHNIIYVTGDIQIQCEKTKYVCGIEATGHIENTDAPLITAYIKANDIAFDGNPIYLLPGGYMKAETTMNFPNSDCNVYAHTGSVALVEATNFEFGNKNDFTHNFSDNIYFKVNGGYIKCDNCYEMGHNHTFNTVAEYLAYNEHNDEYALAKDRINVEISGTSECGGDWKSDDTNPTPDPTPDEVEKNEKPMSWIIACEDLGSKDDIDFNDVVVSVSHVVGQDYAIVTPLAAGGIYNAEIGFIGQEYRFDEIHKLFGKEGEDGSQLMINTGADVDNLEAEPIRINVSENYTLSYDEAQGTNMGGFYIKVSTTNYAQTLKGSGVGEAPQMILVPGDWNWPKERKRIYDVYKNFHLWSEDNNNYDWCYNDFVIDDLYNYTPMTPPTGNFSSAGNDNASDSEYGVKVDSKYYGAGQIIPSSYFANATTKSTIAFLSPNGYSGFNLHISDDPSRSITGGYYSWIGIQQGTIVEYEITGDILNEAKAKGLKFAEDNTQISDGFEMYIKNE